MEDLFGVGSELFAEYVDRRGVIKHYRTSIYQRNEVFLTLLAPAERGLLVPIRPKTPLLLRQIRGDSAYVSEVEVTDEHPDDPALISTTLPEYFETAGQRRFFRVPTDLKYKADHVEGTIVDLSGSGMRVRVPAHSYSSGQKVNIQLELPQSPPFPVQGRVVRLEPAEPWEEAAIMFTLLGDGWRDRIIHYVFQRQSQTIRAQRERE